MESRPRIIVIGGGFAGLWAVRGLRRAAADVLLVDRCNHHTFQPLLYQVATAGLAAPSIAAPLRHILRRQRNVTVLLGEATSIDTTARRVLVNDIPYSYDYLLVAAGAAHAYFGHDDRPGERLLDLSAQCQNHRRVTSVQLSPSEAPSAAISRVLRQEGLVLHMT